MFFIFLYCPCRINETSGLKPLARAALATLAVEAATTGPSQDVALDELRHLLIDNREVITAPPAPPA